MSLTWTPDEAPDPVRIGLAGRLRAIRRGVPMVLLLGVGLAALLALRLVERPLYGAHRPWTPWIAQAVCRGALWLMGLRLAVSGRPMSGPGAEVANHASWLDIFVLNAGSRVYFVSKSEVASWPGIGILARATGTVFIRRERRDARLQAQVFGQRLAAGHRLLFFPEGTSSDTRRVLPFKSTLFEAFFDPSLRRIAQIQPVTVIYTPPPGEPPRFYGWWGDMGFGPHLLKLLAVRRQGRVEVVYHPPFRVADFAGRKALAAACEAAVRGAHPLAEGGQAGELGGGVGVTPDLLAEGKEIGES